MFDSGVSFEGDLIDLAVEDNIISKSGAWLGYKDVRLGQGRENVKQFLRDNPDLADEIRAAVLAKRQPPPSPKAKAVSAPAALAPQPDSKVAPAKRKRA
jgi:recombination protein RecA